MTLIAEASTVHVPTGDRSAAAKTAGAEGSVEYQITVRGSRKTEMVAKADGTVLSFK